LSDKLVWSVTDKGFYSTIKDVTSQLEKMRDAHWAAGVYLQKRLIMKIPGTSGLDAKNIVVWRRGKNTVNVSIEPYQHKRKGGIKRFRAWVRDIEYKRTPFARPTFDSAVQGMVEIFNQGLKKIK